MWLIRHYPVAVGRNSHHSGRCAVIFQSGLGYLHIPLRGFSTKCLHSIWKHDPSALLLSCIKPTTKFKLKAPETPFRPASLLYGLGLKECLLNVVSLSFSKVKKILLFAFKVGILYFVIYGASNLSILVTVQVLLYLDWRKNLLPWWTNQKHSYLFC